jgi:hypothetical protein
VRKIADWLKRSEITHAPSFLNHGICFGKDFVMLTPIDVGKLPTPREFFARKDLDNARPVERVVHDRARMFIDDFPADDRDNLSRMSAMEEHPTHDRHRDRSISIAVWRIAARE